MTSKFKPITILVADDDPDDRLLVEDAILEIQPMQDFLRFVENGEELMDYLHHRGKYSNPNTSPEPDLILLDLNMPRKNGREVILELKTNPQFRHIPIIVLTTSQAAKDITETYNLGINSYITKPKTFEQLVEIMRVLINYWYNITQLPIKAR